MIPAALEKLLYVTTIGLLYIGGRLPEGDPISAPIGVNGVMGVFFVLAFINTATAADESGPR